jgi:hypothetical protein
MRTWLYDRLQAVDPRSLDGLAAGQLVNPLAHPTSTSWSSSPRSCRVLVGTVILTPWAVVMVISTRSWAR